MDPSIQQGAAMAALGLAGTVAGLFFGYLKDRDKFRYDHKIQALENQNAAQAGEMLRLKVDHDACEARQKATDARLATIEAALAQKKDRTGYDHEPLP